MECVFANIVHKKYALKGFFLPCVSGGAAHRGAGKASVPVNNDGVRGIISGTGYGETTLCNGHKCQGVIGTIQISYHHSPI